MMNAHVAQWYQFRCWVANNNNHALQAWYHAQWRLEIAAHD